MWRRGRNVLTLPAPFGGEDGEDDSLGGADGGYAKGLRFGRVEGSIEETSNHVDATSLNLAESGVL